MSAILAVICIYLTEMIVCRGIPVVSGHYRVLRFRDVKASMSLTSVYQITSLPVYQMASLPVCLQVYIIESGRHEEELQLPLA